jgi:MoaA/NifB/PqqE/SkfB family radical SAM enzyme
VEQFEDLLDHVGREWAPFTPRGHITLTGGEPFLHPHFTDLMEVIAAKPRLGFAILSNGTFIDADMAGRLRELAPAFVQVSIEGDR